MSCTEYNLNEQWAILLVRGLISKQLLQNGVLHQDEEKNIDYYEGYAGSILLGLMQRVPKVGP